MDFKRVQRLANRTAMTLAAVFLFALVGWAVEEKGELASL